MATLVEIRAAVRSNLSDASTVWTDAEIDRAVDEVTADFSRMIPDEKIHEIIIDKNITDEAWTSDSGVAVTLGNKPIDFGSETVKQSTTVFVRNTDYTMNYANGTVTMLAAGSMADSTASTITYTKQSIAFDLSALTDLTTVIKVETSVGDVPQEHSSFFIWGTTLWVTTQGFGTQSPVGDKTHLRIYYYAEHTPPAAGAGSFPLFLDEVMIKGAVSYCLFIKHREQLQSGQTEIELGNTALDDLLKNGGTVEDIETALTEFDVVEANIGTNLILAATKIVEAKVEYDVAIDSLIGEVDSILDTALTHLTGVNDSVKEALDALTSGAYNAAAKTALDKVLTYLEGSTNSAKAALQDIIDNTNMADANTALDKVIVYLDLIMNEGATSGYLQEAEDVWAEEVKHILTDAGLPNAEDFLETGDDLINAVNLGVQAANLYATYAQNALGMGDRWSDRRKDFIAMSDRLNAIGQTYIQEAAMRQGATDRLVNEASTWVDVSETFIAEAEERLRQVDRFLGEAAQWRGVAQTMNDFATNRNSNAQLQIQAANGYVSMAMAYIEQAEGYVANGEILIQKAQIRLGIGNLNVAEGQGRVVIGNSYLTIADRYRDDALERHADYWSMLRSRVQQARQRSMVSVNQYPTPGSPSAGRLADLPG